MTDEEAIKEFLIQGHKAGIDKFYEEIIEKLKFVKNNKKECQEMTDEEIIKEFELFIKYYASEKVLDDALDLINRQQSEIERLTAERDEARQDCAVAERNHQLAVAEREANVKEFAETLKTIKAKAIKEFAERLKKLKQMPLITNNDIDNLVKEMSVEK